MKILLMTLVFFSSLVVRANNFCLSIQSQQISYVNSIWNEFLCNDGVQSETPRLSTLIFLLPIPQKNNNEKKFQEFLKSKNLKQVSLLKSSYYKKNRSSQWFQCNGIRLLESVDAKIGSNYCIVSKISSMPMGIDQKIKNSYEVVCTDQTQNTFNGISEKELEEYFENQRMTKIMDVDLEVNKISGFSFTLGCTYVASDGPQIKKYKVFKRL